MLHLPPLTNVLSPTIVTSLILPSSLARYRCSPVQQHTTQYLQSEARHPSLFALDLRILKHLDLCVSSIKPRPVQQLHAGWLAGIIKHHTSLGSEFGHNYSISNPPAKHKNTHHVEEHLPFFLDPLAPCLAPAAVIMAASNTTQLVVTILVFILPVFGYIYFTKRQQVNNSSAGPLPAPTEITALHIHPIKSCHGISVQSAKLLPTGLDLGK